MEQAHVVAQSCGIRGTQVMPKVVAASEVEDTLHGAAQPAACARQPQLFGDGKGVGMPLAAVFLGAGRVLARRVMRLRPRRGRSRAVPQRGSGGPAYEQDKLLLAEEIRSDLRARSVPAPLRCFATTTVGDARDCRRNRTAVVRSTCTRLAGGTRLWPTGRGQRKSSFTPFPSCRLV